MNWFEKVSSYIEGNLDGFIAHFFSTSNQTTRSKSIYLNPSPCCGHNDCMSFAKDKPVGYCFSCGTKGNRIQFVEQVWGKEEGRVELGKWSGYPYRTEFNSQKREEISRHSARVQEIINKTVDLYHYVLMNTEKGEKALAKQLGSDISKGQRGHELATIENFKIGLSTVDFSEIKKWLMNTHGFTDAEVEEANDFIWVPPNYYIYPYYDLKGNVIRINTKPYLRTCLGDVNPDGSTKKNCNCVLEDVSKKAKRDHEEATGHKMSPDAYSRGEKDFAIFMDPNHKWKKKYLILVEGENDVLSVYEELQKLSTDYKRNFFIVGIGGNVPEGFFELPFFRGFERIYEAFDHDKAGDGYRERLNLEAPDIPVYKIPFDEDFDDIDNYLKAPLKDRAPLLELLENAEFVETKEIMFERIQSFQHEWVARNRSFQLRFKINSYNYKQSQFEGTLIIVVQGDEVWRKTGGIDNLRVDPTFNAAKLKLSSYLEDYYNVVPWDKGVPKRTFEDLTDILSLTKNYEQVTKQIAWYLYKTESVEEHQILFKNFRNKISDDKKVAEVLKEVNAYTNVDLDPNILIMPINLSQHFNISNDDAFFYFSRIVKDGDVTKLVPCLLSNHKEEIRLDLLQKKDPQSILLIKNKYELPEEIPTAAMKPVEVSLQQMWVDRWKNGEVKDHEMEPSTVIQEIEDFITRCYYLPTTTKKVLALWIYSTYYYTLFKSGFPYLLFTGEKGTGKSTLDTIVYLLALNAKLALDMSESALYRTITLEGGTFILDEVEHLTDKKKVDQNGYAKILKGGYAEYAYVYRTNSDRGNATDRFSVFGPKVISNINGIDDVIADRCIYIRTYRVSEDKLRALEDVHIYKEERRADAHSITSRCVLSALNNFKKVHEIFTTTERLETGNARLTQILKPLHVIAKLVGGDYEEHLMKFYNSDVKTAKDEIAENTVEGMIKNILKTAARELTGIESKRWVTNKESHVYPAPIPYNPKTRQFEMDSLHFKVLCEEYDTTLDISIREINNKLKNILGQNFDPKAHRSRSSVVLENENLQKIFQNKRSITVYKYTFNIKDYLTAEEYKSIGEVDNLVTNTLF